MRELLDKARPGWTWEPTLVEVDGERVRVFTGVKLRSRLVVGLGPRRALRVAQLVQQVLALKAEVDQGNRVTLTVLEYRLLEELVCHTGTTLTHRHLLQQVWGEQHLAETQYLTVLS